MSGSSSGDAHERCVNWTSLAERPAGATREHGVHFADDGERDGFGRAPADVEPDGRAQPRAQRGGVVARGRSCSFSRRAAGPNKPT